MFFRRWPDPQRWAEQPLTARLSAGSATRPIITFLMLHRVLRPGYDYLLERKLSSIWREIKDSPLGPDLDRFMATAAELGFTERVRFATGSQVPARLLIQTGRRLDQLTIADLDAFTAACHDRHERTGKGHQHYLAAVSNTQRVLFHLGIVDQLPRSGGPVPFAERLAEVRATDPRDDDRLPGSQAGDLPGQDGLGDRDPAQALRGVPRRRRPRPGLDRPPRPPPTHRALPDLAGRRGERQERRADHRRRPLPAGARADRRS